MPRKPKHTIEIDLSDVLASMTAAIFGAVKAATDTIVGEAKQVSVKPTKAPRKPKPAPADKPAKEAAPKRTRASKADSGALADTLAGFLRVHGSPMAMADLVAGSGANAGQILRALKSIPGLVVTGAKRGTRYSLAPVQVNGANESPPMGVGA